MNGDGWVDVVVGCYISNSFPPYTDWENLIYFNTGGHLEASPSLGLGRRGLHRRHPGGPDQRRPVSRRLRRQRRRPLPTLGDLLRRARRSGHHAGLVEPGAGRRLEQLRDAVRHRPRRRHRRDHRQPGQLAQSTPTGPCSCSSTTAARSRPCPSWQSAEKSIQNFLALARLRRRRLGGSGRLQVGQLRERHLRQPRRRAADRLRSGPRATPTPTRASPGPTSTRTAGPTSPSATTRPSSGSTTPAP